MAGEGRGSFNNNCPVQPKQECRLAKWRLSRSAFNDYSLAVRQHTSEAAYCFCFYRRPCVRTAINWKGVHHKLVQFGRNMCYGDLNVGDIW